MIFSFIVIYVSKNDFISYGIRPEALGRLLQRSSNIFAIFVGSLGDQAERLRQKLPADRAFVCAETGQLPLIFRRIFEASLSTSD